MAQFNLLDTDTVTLTNVFERTGNYTVPDFQRDYSWKKEHWEDLWEDISEVRKPSSTVHYMGALVMQNKKGDKNLKVIDGQQRLATLSIVALAIVKRLTDFVDNDIDVQDNKSRIELLMSQYVGIKDAVSLHYSNKLKLNENNEPFYSNFLVQLKRPQNEKALSSSDKLMYGAFQFFYKKIKDEFPLDSGGDKLASLLTNQIAEKLTFIQVVVEDELNAYTVFETLNSRGVELGTSDLLKNYVLSKAADSELDKQKAKEQWLRITRLIDLKDFPNFLRYYWHSRYHTIRKEQLYKALRNSVGDKVQAFELLDDLEKYADVYSALDDPNDPKWSEDTGIAKHLKELKLFGVRQQIPLLMAAYLNLPINHFSTVLRFCLVIAFRYNVIGNADPKKQERFFHSASKGVTNGSLNTPAKIAYELRGIYDNDEKFVSNFRLKSLSAKKDAGLIRYILFALENQGSGVKMSYETDPATIEHILPENPTPAWNAMIGGEQNHESLVNRLGNLLLLESKLNRDSGTKPIGEKLSLFAKSDYPSAKAMSVEVWDEKSISRRQEKMARTAKSVWKITQLDQAKKA